MRETFLDPFAARQLGALELAYIGDSVYECRVRSMLILRGGGKMKALHREAVSYVRATYQSAAYTRILPKLTETEAEVCRRARNASPGTLPKSASAKEYHEATALEALIGYLYISDQQARLDALLDEILNPIPSQEENHAG